MTKFFEDGDVERPVFPFDCGHVFLKAEVRDIVRLFGLLFQLHVGLLRSFVGLLEIAFAAAGDEVFPSVWPASPARDDVVEGEVAGGSAILAFVVIAGEDAVSREP